MKRIYTIIFFSFIIVSSAMAQSISKVTKTITSIIPNLPVVYQTDVKGGYHVATDLLTTGDIAANKKETGMIAWNITTSCHYQWDGAEWNAIRVIKDWMIGDAKIGQLYIKDDKIFRVKSDNTITGTTDPDTDTANWSAVGVNIEDVLTSTSVINALSANQGKVLDGKITANNTSVNTKVDKIITVNGHALSSNVTVTKADVGLGNVTNTSDAAKPVSTATQTELNLKLNKSSVENVLTSTSATNALSAKQGKVLKGLVDVNTGKTGISSAQASAILVNSAKVGDDLGDHTATENLKMGVNYINEDGGAAKGLKFDAAGNATFMQDVKIQGDFTVPSDARLKTHIQVAQGMLGKISHLNGVSYQYINQNKYAKGTRYGFIAQELKTQFPEMVKQDGDGLYSVDYLQMTAVLLQAIKEQQLMINELMKQNQSLMTND